MSTQHAAENTKQANARTALAVVAQPQTVQLVKYSREWMDLVKRTCVPQGIPDAEFALFLEQCRRTGLDPLIKQCFCVKRSQNIGSKQSPRYVDKFEFQAAESGMLARAEDFPDYLGTTSGAVYAQDQVAIDPGAGVVAHRFNPVGNRGALAGAWARVERRGRTAVVVWLKLEDYKQNNPMWERLPATMIQKCAKVAGLRTAFPVEFGGIYTGDEMPPSEDDEHHPRTAAPETPLLPPAPPVPELPLGLTVEEREFLADLHDNAMEHCETGEAFRARWIVVAQKLHDDGHDKDSSLLALALKAMQDACKQKTGAWMPKPSRVAAEVQRDAELRDLKRDEYDRDRDHTDV